ncbi:MAG: hypothetical protein ICV64_07780 [Thermoleophilia bacterium]|nr:hypothetical protein [Thermoleophilia bacterium]
MSRSLLTALALVALLASSQATAAPRHATQAADLSLRLSAGGGATDWFVAFADVANRGPGDAEDVVVRFHLPDGAHRLADGPRWSSSPECGTGTTCVIPRIRRESWASVAVIFRPGPDTFAPVGATVSSRTEDANPSDNSATATPQIVPPPPPGVPPVPPPPAPRPPSAVLATRAATFLLAPAYSTWLPEAPVAVRPSGPPPSATVAATTGPDPRFPALAHRLVLRRNALVRLDLAFVPSSYRFRHRGLRRSVLSRGRFGAVRLLWRVPPGVKRGRAVLMTRDLIGNELTYSFRFVVRPHD